MMALFNEAMEGVVLEKGLGAIGMHFDGEATCGIVGVVAFSDLFTIGHLHAAFTTEAVVGKSGGGSGGSVFFEEEEG